MKTGIPWLDQQIKVLEHARPGQMITDVVMGKQPWEPVYFVWDGPIKEFPPLTTSPD